MKRKVWTSLRIAMGALFVLIVISACTPQKRLERLLAKFPELQHHDTTTKTISDTTAAIDVKITTPIDTAGKIKLDSLIQLYVLATEDLYSLKMNDSILWKKTRDSIVKKSNAALYKYMANYRFLKDTVIKFDSINNVTVKVWQDGKGIGTSIYKPISVKDHTVTSISNNLTPCPPYETAWYDVGSRWLNLFFLLLIALISYLYFKSKK